MAIEVIEERSKELEARLNGFWKLSLREVVSIENELLDLCNETEDGVLPDDVWGIIKAAKELQAGKIDNIAVLVKSVIPSHRDAVKEAAQAQIAKLDKVEDKLKKLTEEAIHLKGGGHLNGTMWRARVHSSSAVDIQDPDMVPDEHKTMKMSIEMKFPAGDDDMKNYWQQVIDYFKDNASFKGSINPEVSKTSLRQALKEKDIPGVGIQKNYHVRYEAGKAEPKKVRGKK